MDKQQAQAENEIEIGDMVSSIEKYLFDIRSELLRIRHTMTGIAFVLIFVLLLQSFSR